MALSKTYKIVEFDANDVPTVYKTGLTRSAAHDILTGLRFRSVMDKTSFHYIMARDRNEPGYDARVGDHLWTGNMNEEE